MIEFDLDVDVDFSEPGTSTRSRLVFDLDVDATIRRPTGGIRRRVLLVHQSGEVITELERAVASEPTEELGSWESAKFTLPTEDPKLALVLEKKLAEVQIWRGNRLLIWGPITRPQISPAGCSFDVKGAGWYFSRRYVGSAAVVNRLRNADFAVDFTGWRQRMAAWFLDFEAIPFGMAGILDDPARTGARSVILTTHYTDLSHPGAQQASLSQDVEVDVGPFGATATLTAWCYVPEADFVSYGPEKRRGLKIARMPLDYRTNNFFTRTGGVNGWGGSRAFYTDFLDYDIAPIAESDPFDSWMKLEAAVEIPPNFHGIITAALEGIEGKTIWSKPRLTITDGLSFSNIDQAEIVAGLVDHAQDPAFGKTDLNIGTTGSSSTGVVRSLFAPYHEHANLWDLLKGYTMLDDGLDLSMSYSARRRSLQVHYPFRGALRPELELRSDRNVADWSYVFDGENASSSEIVTGAGTADSREEAAAVETTDFADGLVLESVRSAPPETADDDLPELARALLASELEPEVIDFVTHPLSPLIDELELGDIVPIMLTKGAFLAAGEWRLVKRTERDDLSLAGTLNKVRSSP